MARRCSFCNRKESKVNRLISGPEGSYICDECVEICCEILRENDPGFAVMQAEKIITGLDPPGYFDFLEEKEDLKVFATRSIVAIFDDIYIYAPVTGEMVINSEEEGSFTGRDENDLAYITFIPSNCIFYAPSAGSLMYTEQYKSLAIVIDEGEEEIDSLEDMFILCPVDLKNITMLVDYKDRRRVQAGQPLFQFDPAKYQRGTDSSHDISLHFVKAKCKNRRCGNYIIQDHYRNLVVDEGRYVPQHQTNQAAQDVQPSGERTFTEEDLRYVFGDIFPKMFGQNIHKEDDSGNKPGQAAVSADPPVYTDGAGEGQSKASRFPQSDGTEKSEPSAPEDNAKPAKEPEESQGNVSLEDLEKKWTDLLF